MSQYMIIMIILVQPGNNISLNIILKIMSNSFFSVHRQFYDAPSTTLCDICDEKLCSQECLLARQRQSQENAIRGNIASNNFSSAIPKFLILCNVVTLLISPIIMLLY